MHNKLCSLLLLSGALATAGFLPAAAHGTGDSSETPEKVNVNEPHHIELGARVDYQREYRQGDAYKDNCGFKGKYLLLTMNGDITKKFAYAFRHRINVTKFDKSFFDATDVISLKYRFTDHWDVTGGKMAYAFGSYEYERHPMDTYLPSEFWTMIPCYQFGVTLGYNPTEKDRLMAQFMQSPFRQSGEEMYGYSLCWYGYHGWFNTIYSANMMEYRPGKFIYYLGLGHHLDFGKVVVELDYLNRATADNGFFDDYSLIGEVAVKPAEKWNVFAKASYNRNVTSDPADVCVFPGTDATQVGGGMEFFPLPNGDKTLRVHAAYSYCFGKNGNTAGTLQKDQHFMSVGLQWRMDLLGLARKIRNR